MSRRALASLLCLLALLAPAGAALAVGLSSSTCADACCEDELPACGDDDGCSDHDEECPAGCPDCACSARARVALPPHAAVPPFEETADPDASREPPALVADADPRDILHVPRG